MLSKPKRRFDFIQLENDALAAWAEWDKHDNQASRTKMFQKIKDLTYAIIFAGDFEKKFKIRLGDDNESNSSERIHQAATEYTIYLFERIVTRSKSFYPQQKYIDIDLQGGDINDEDLVYALVKKACMHKQPFEVVSKVAAIAYDVECKTHLGGGKAWKTEIILPRGTKLSQEEIRAQLKDAVLNSESTPKKLEVTNFKARKQNYYRVYYKFLKFALQPYINQNIRHVLLSNNFHEVSDAIELLEDALEEGEEVAINPAFVAKDNLSLESLRFSHKYLAEKIYKAMKSFFPPEEIRRLYPITLSLMENNSKFLIDPELPDDIKDFAVVLIGLGKKLLRETQTINKDRISKKEFTKALETAVKSSLFLSSVVNSAFIKKEFLLALDLDSIYRLSSVLGGETVKIPTLRELDSLLGAVSAVSQCLLKGEDPATAVRKSKEDLKLVFAHRVNLESFVANAIKSYKLFGEDKDTQPLVSVLLGSISCLEKIFDGIMEKKKSASPEALATIYTEMVNSCAKFSDSLVTISQSGRQKIIEGLEPKNEKFE